MNKIKDQILVGKHKDIEIFLSTGSNQFRVKDERLSNYYDSYGKMLDAIDRMLSAESNLKLKDLKIELPVLTDHGQEVTLVGINRTDASAMLKEKGDIKSGNTFYPREKWVQQALARRAAIGDELRAIDRKLEKIGVTLTRWSGRISAEDYPERIETLKHNLAQAAKRAKDMA